MSEFWVDVIVVVLIMWIGIIVWETVKMSVDFVFNLNKPKNQVKEK